VIQLKRFTSEYAKISTRVIFPVEGEHPSQVTSAGYEEKKEKGLAIKIEIKENEKFLRNLMIPYLYLLLRYRFPGFDCGHFCMSVPLPLSQAL
jgi:hypothetical protein